jgi:predicted xylose isomerase-like sugar epimerase
LFSELDKDDRAECRTIYISYLRRAKAIDQLIALFTHLNQPREVARAMMADAVADKVGFATVNANDAETDDERKARSLEQLTTREAKLRACETYCREHKLTDLVESVRVLLCQLRKAKKAEEVISGFRVCWMVA